MTQHQPNTTMTDTNEQAPSLIELMLLPAPPGSAPGVPVTDDGARQVPSTIQNP